MQYIRLQLRSLPDYRRELQHFEGGCSIRRHRHLVQGPAILRWGQQKANHVLVERLCEILAKIKRRTCTDAHPWAATIVGRTTIFLQICCLALEGMLSAAKNTWVYGENGFLSDGTWSGMGAIDVLWSVTIQRLEASSGPFHRASLGWLAIRTKAANNQEFENCQVAISLHYYLANSFSIIALITSIILLLSYHNLFYIPFKITRRYIAIALNN